VEPTRDVYLEKLIAHAPVYARVIERHPDYYAWLKQSENQCENYRYSAFLTNWHNDFAPDPSSAVAALQKALARFRQKMSLRIAYRDIHGLSTVENTLWELSVLAEVCVQISCQCLQALWRKRLGTPINDETHMPARFCILGMGKLGGRELNFWSDIDLIYLFDGNGSCRKNDKRTAITNQEYFHRFFRDLSRFLHERSDAGALYNLDLRLRPEGNSGPIARSFDSMESYYWTAGQTWERLAFVRARPIAGDTALGAEFLEQLTPFVYPRFPRSSIFHEIAGVKLRIERETVGSDNAYLDIKSGYGGIREIEYQVQALQMTQGGRNPFLQTTSILEALDQLEKYAILPFAKTRFLRHAYLMLRHIENRLQMKHETQVHTIPPAGVDREKLATGLGYASEADFSTTLADLQAQVRHSYLEIFETDETESDIVEWTLLFSGKAASSAVKQKLEHWFPHEHDTPARLTQFAIGSTHQVITREQVMLFLEVTRSFDDLLPHLATPLQTLERVAQFADCYGARKHFFKTALDQQYFNVLCLLFDGSRFIHTLLCRHPEIIEELLYESPSRRKSLQAIQDEIAQLPDDETFPRLLWLYVKAEQVRLAIGERMQSTTIGDTRERLTTLADAAVGWVLNKVDPTKRLAIIALGKYASRQLDFGSDMDMLVLGEQNTFEQDSIHLNQLIKILQYTSGLGHTLNIDLRLRPHGNDSPSVTTLHALQRYHRSGQAHMWEKQLLARYRPVAGNVELLQKFQPFVDQHIYTRSLDNEAIASIWNMRLKAEREVSRHYTMPARAIKKGPGGIMDIDCWTQLLQLKYGHQYPELRTPNPHTVVQAAGKAALVHPETAIRLLEDYTFLRRVEFYLRRLEFAPDSVIPAIAATENALARWMNFNNFNDLLESITIRMQNTRADINNWFANCRCQ